MSSHPTSPPALSPEDPLRTVKRTKSQAAIRAGVTVAIVMSTISLLSAMLFVCPESAPRRAISTLANSSESDFQPLPEPQALSIEDRSILRRKAQRNVKSWLRYLRKLRPTGEINTQRLGCREMQAGAQSCVFEGVTCINTSSQQQLDRPEVYFLVDREEDWSEASGDGWCYYRHQSSDPRYYSASRHWPIREDTFSPQHSCLNAYYRSQKSLFGGGIPKLNIKWLDSLWLIDLDYTRNPHNAHLLMEILWVLDVVLWQKAIDLRRPLDDLQSGVYDGTPGHLFTDGPQHLYLPQGETDFISQTHVDVNRLTYSLVLQRDLSQLYPNFTADEMQQPPTDKRLTASLLAAYPDLKRDERLLFHHDLIKDESVDLVCAPRFTSGAKIANGAHERVCRYMREQSHKFFGIEEPEMQRLGQAFYPQPPKRLIILQRHITRGIANLEQLEMAMRDAFSRYDVEIEVVSTSEMVTAEDQVRTFARAGVLLTPHGSQSMGQIWMPRHSAIIEVMPVGYTDYLFQVLSESCKIWYYELQSKVPESKESGRTNEEYEKGCGQNRPHLLSPCNTFKSESVTVHIDQAVNKVRYAFERMGHEVGPWLKTVNSGLWMS